MYATITRSTLSRPHQCNVDLPHKEVAHGPEVVFCLEDELDDVSEVPVARGLATKRDVLGEKRCSGIREE